MRAFPTTRRVFVRVATMLAISLGPVVGDAQPKVSEWKLTQAFAFGDGSDVVLERVRSLQLLRDGRLLVADVGAKSVFVSDSLGRAQKTLGRVGAGPAEYGSPGSLATIGDTIAVLDVVNTRIGLFNGKGEWQGQWPSQRISGPGVRLFRTQAGEFYNYSTKPDGKVLRTVYIRYDKAGARDTVVPAPFPTSVTFVRCNSPGGGISFFDSKFGTKELRIPGAGGTVLDGMSDKYQLQLHKVNGDVVASFSGTAARVPLGDKEWQESIKDFTEFAKKNTTGACTHSSVERPSAKPAIRAVWWDDAGRLWVERYAAKGFAFDVFSKTGTQLATMPAPERVEDVEPNVVGNRLAVLTLTTDGVPVVRVYRIAPVK
ncbi:MAG: hypothetical protein ABI120_20860 [Gemmatimonadaceae bacterium]